MPRCPYCGSEDLTPIKSWRFRIYEVTRYRCNKCGGEFNHYVNTTGRGKPEYYIPKPTRKVPSATPSFDHETVKGWLVKIGEVLGYYVKTEFEGDIHRFDVVWWDSERDFNGKKHPAAVFEVQRGGSLVEALARLKHALDRWNIYGLYLVVTEEGDVERARRLVEPHLKGSFHELQGRLRIWTAKRVREIRDALTKYRDEVRELSTLRD
jgi:hypothetical protein